MEFAVENLFHFLNPLKWNCSIYSISSEGDVTIVVLPSPPSRSRLHIVLENVIYYDTYPGWSGVSINIANQDEFQNFIPQLGKTLQEEIGTQTLMAEYKLYVIPTSSKNHHFVGKNAAIAKILP
jgi:hypothetical protein